MWMRRRPSYREEEEAHALPFAPRQRHVDVELRKRVLEYLLRVREEFPIPLIYVTHDLDEAQRICETTVVMERGHVRVGTPS
jgi:ABC-type molybdate transport system ATPase subunit